MSVITTFSKHDFYVANLFLFHILNNNIHKIYSNYCLPKNWGNNIKIRIRRNYLVNKNLMHDQNWFNIYFLNIIKKIKISKYNKI
ncbi:hypothetical protein PFAG_05205 [Plasmodium falciparum Santa Lucia]|uniref:Uncharacterized protein n=1 Tax=Plasmodium falciparum Santa Lucia TaxID=478859 RepID=W7FP44_PLAFA|nr:hypothetical protein PFAG_05205 [Plasmodium falciparum Santa Lucia]